MANTTTPEYDTLLELLQRRRSIRRFRPDPVDDETVARLVEAARFAPSAGNAQPWDLIVVRDPDTRKTIGDIFHRQAVTKHQMELARTPELQHPYPNPPAPTGAPPFVDAGALIVVVGDPRLIEAYPYRTKLDKGPQHIISSLANLVLTLHYAAASLGLVSHWLSDTGSPDMEVYLRQMLGFPEPLKAYETVVVGYAETEEPTSPRYTKTFDDIVHFERYDPSRFLDEAALHDHVIAKLRRRPPG